MPLPPLSLAEIHWIPIVQPPNSASDLCHEGREGRAGCQDTALEGYHGSWQQYEA